MSRLLCYHDFSKRLTAGISAVSVDRMAAQLRALRLRGYRFGTLEAPTGPRQLAISLDDALADQLELALPVLAELNMSATAFVVTDFVGRPASWDYRGRQRRHADWSQLRDWLGSGMKIGSHTATHRDLRGLGKGHLEAELVTSRKRLEDRLGHAVASVAYPFGRFDRTVLEWAGRAGYHNGFSTRPDRSGDHPLARGRVVVSRLDTVTSLAHRLEDTWWGRVERGKQDLIRFWSGGTSVMQYWAGAKP